MKPRELLAALVVLVGGSLWLVLPDSEGGSLRDRSVTARWQLPPGEGFAAWVVVQNAGQRTIELTGASIGSDLPEGVEVRNVQARIGAVPAHEPDSEGPQPFLRIDGFEIPPGRNATIGFGLDLPQEGLVALEDVTVAYREGGDEQTLQARRTARICVAVSRRAC